MIKNKINQFNPGLTQFSPNRGFSPTRVEPGFNPGGGLNLPTLACSDMTFIVLQVQAIVVGFLASVAAMIFGWIPKGVFDIHHGFILCASSVVTASLASLILGEFECLT